MSSLENNKQVARQFFEAMGGGDPSILKTILDPACTFNIPNTSCLGGSHNLQDFAKIGQMLGAACPDGVKLEVVGLTAEDDRVACQVEGSAKTADGGEYNNRYHMLLKIKDGRIYETHEYMDSLLVEKVFSSYMKK
jgi:uncharacterized protein